MIPERFGKYTLLQSLAKGGMGEVFLARAGKRGFERLFAIKRILTQHEGTESFSKMLMDEARISIRLQHPNIAQVFEFGQEGEAFFLVMEYIEGLSLSGLLRAGRLQESRMSTADALSITRELCRALDYAHRKKDVDGKPLNIVHRDISPHNVLIDENGTVKLIDFGIAKASQNNVITEAGALKGKIPYMAPEQAAGKPVDHRLDLYAVGAVLYECLAYERLFPRGESMAVLAKVIKGEFPDFKTQCPDLPREIYEILYRSITKDMKVRYPDAATMEADVAKALAIVAPAYTPRSLAKYLESVEVRRARRKKAIASYMSAESIAEVDSETNTREMLPSDTDIPKVVGVATEDHVADAPFTDSGVNITIVTPPPLGKTVASDPQMQPLGEDGQPIIIGPPGGPPRRGPVIALVASALVLFAVYWLFVGGETETSDEIVFHASQEPEADTPDPRVEANAAGQANGRTDAGGSASAADIATPSDKPEASAQVTRTKRAKGRKAARKPKPKSGSTPTTETPTKPKATEQRAPKAKKQGCVIVGAEPWADVYVGGKKRGTTPMVCLKLSEGTHTLTLKNPALGKEQKKRVTVNASKKSKVFVAF